MATQPQPSAHAFDTAAASPGITEPEIVALSRLAHTETGIHIDTRKGDFLVARLSGHMRRLGLDRFSDYAALLSRREMATERKRFAESLTTHTTEFLRERRQYDWLRCEAVHELAKRGVGKSSDLTVWSAACSTGQELYSALMLLDEVRETQITDLRFRGMGTDISEQVVTRAMSGLYLASEIESLPEPWKIKYLLRSKSRPGVFRIRDTLRDRSEWMTRNLCEPKDAGSINAHVVFLRNVLIYFDPMMRERILKAVIREIAQGGFLLTGHSEAIDARRYGLSALQPSIYRKEAS